MLSNASVRIMILIITFFMLFSASGLNAQDDSSSGSVLGNYLNIYVYPVSLLGSLGVAMLNGDDSEGEDNYGKWYLTNIYLTAELLVSDPFTIIITPSYQGWNYLNTGYDDEGWMDHDRIGSDLGVRLYTSGESSGFFLQATGGIYYYKRDIKYRDYPLEDVSYRAILYQGMGYIGYIYNDMCLSFGAGYNRYKEKSLSYSENEEKHDLTKSFAQRGFAFDISFSFRLMPMPQ